LGPREQADHNYQLTSCERNNRDRCRVKSHSCTRYRHTLTRHSESRIDLSGCIRQC
jgi:hypothetical protein